MAVTHDRYFLDNVAGWILELDRGQGIPFEGNYSGVLRAMTQVTDFFCFVSSWLYVLCVFILLSD